MTNLDIYNNIPSSITSDDNYKKFNDFIFSDDIRVTGKMLIRFEHFLRTKDLPGDIVEIGTYKGSGISTFLKFIQIYCPNSNKKVIGFDIFPENENDYNKVLDNDTELDKSKMLNIYSRIPLEEISIDAVSNRLKKTKIDRFILVKGSVEESIPKFLDENPGLRISLLYIDVDLERPTYYSLRYLWSRLLPGSVIIFDEYEYHKFSESNGADKFFKEIGYEPNLISTNFFAPTCYLLVKK
jgi:hypothetical protein